ncbi:MAG TPA: SWIM zinc finger family protein, partial [Pyrinomonadaceae bacterium]|nr:SWIM zinc finger family protein [Pyrinomonadaceae bacterium]
RAQCEGSDYEPYQVSATLTESGIARTSCTCPYDYGGVCKHIVALLLTYIKDPQSFRSIPPLTELLADRSREELIALIGEMIEREPELLSLVELSVAAGQARQGETLDVDAYRRQARNALRRGSPRAVEKELLSLLELAARLDRAGDWLDAGTIYHALLEETVSGYEDMLWEMDEEGDIAAVIDEFAQGLSRCLKEGSADDGTQRAWLEGLLEAELTDIEIGGVGLAPSARLAVIENATDEEWEWVEKRIQAAISKGGDWAREELARFLAARRKRHRGSGKVPAKKRTRKSST